MIVVDTNVVSELMTPSPAAVVRDWTLGRSPTEMFTTSITVAEILYGIERLPEGQRKDMLRTAATDVFTSFEDHVLPFDHDAAGGIRAAGPSRRPAGTTHRRIRCADFACP